jgi:hypothetical protein
MAAAYFAAGAVSGEAGVLPAMDQQFTALRG